jgi:hypothetical protein
MKDSTSNTGQHTPDLFGAVGNPRRQTATHRQSYGRDGLPADNATIFQGSTIYAEKLTAALRGD